jgi:hypothetical protein
VFGLDGRKVAICHFSDGLFGVAGNVKLTPSLKYPSEAFLAFRDPAFWGFDFNPADPLRAVRECFRNQLVWDGTDLSVIVYLKPCFAEGFRDDFVVAVPSCGVSHSLASLMQRISHICHQILFGRVNGGIRTIS